MRRSSLFLGAAICVVLAFVTLAASQPQRPTVRPRVPGTITAHPRNVFRIKPFVRGYIAVRVPLGARAQLTAVAVSRQVKDVFLPRVKVHLLNLANNSRSDAVTTDLSGRFTIPASAGRYRICWEARGIPPGCGENIVSVGNVPVHLSTVRIPLKNAAGQAVVFGSVQLSDGSSVRLLEPLADVNAFGRVVLLDQAKKEKFDVLVNNFGDYLIPDVPTGAQIYLAARAGAKGEGIQEIRPQANLKGAPFHRIDLTIRNAPPRLEPLVPRHGSGDRVQVASPGEALAIEAMAKDPDGDPLEFRWLADTGAASLSAATGKSVKWTLPAAEGHYSLTLIASDEKGGYTRRVVAVRADRQGVVFSGRVVTIEGSPIAKARVTVNGKAASTDAIGFFRLHVRPEDRYVVNVRAAGFAFLSRISGSAVTGAVYRLRRATVVTANPAADIDVQDKRTVRDCPGPASLRFDAKTFPGGVKPVYQDGKGNVVKAKREALVSLARYRRQEGCGPGVRVRIPASSLQDSAGNAPAGQVQISLSTVDLLSPDQMPGDYTVALPGGDTRVMESYGAAVVEITSGGKPLNLKPGAMAEVTIPVDQAQIAAGGPLPPTIPVLFYDENRGVWREELTATLQGAAYVAKVPHFSAVNMDLVKTNQACVRVDASDPGLPGTFRMQVIVPLGPNVAPRVRDENINNSLQKEHVLYNLPTNTNITLAPYDGVTGIPYGTFVVNTGGAQNPTNPNLPFGPPYLACSTLVVLTPQALPQDPTGGEFLHGLFSFAATLLVETDIVDPNTLSGQLDQATTNYYNQVDPLPSQRATLGAFKGLWGFGAGGPGCANLAAGETCAIYANSGDLGFGREMHCIKSGANVACYVTNYGNINTPDDLDVADAVAGSGKIATVAMEYAPIENDPSNLPVVKFFVYNNVDARVNNADLDGKGLRPVPQLCMTCHGGNYPGGPNVGVPGFNNADDVKLGSEFLAFDLHNFTFAAAPFDKASQQDEFKTLNEQMVLAGNAGDHTQLYIAEMYDGDNGVPANSQEELLVISDPNAPAAGDRWTAQAAKQEMYKHVIGNACRTCHATNPTPSLRFNHAKQVIDILGNVEVRVCSQHIMPHAKRTHDLFWQSTNRPDTPILDPHQPGILQAFGDTFGNNVNGWQGTLCGVFTGGGVSPPSAFDDIKNQILTPLCSGCHVGGAPPGNLNLQAANAHAQLVNVNACERPVMKRVQPGSANDSFFFRKVEGTHGGLGGCNVAGCNPFGGEAGCGFQMPWTGAVVSNSPLSGAQLDLIEDWINVGAPN